MDVLRLITNPRCYNKAITVSVTIKSSLIDLHGNIMSSKLITILIFNLLIRDIGNFKILVKILGIGPKPKHRQRNSQSFSDH